MSRHLYKIKARYANAGIHEFYVVAPDIESVIKHFKRESEVLSVDLLDNFIVEIEK